MSFRTVLLLTAVMIWRVATDTEVCFDKIGCLSMSFPWASVLRQVPAPLPPDELPIKLYFFSRESRDAVHTMTPFPEMNLHRAPFKPSRPTIVITHDYDDNGNDSWMYSLKDAYLQNVDSNVVILDWKSGSYEFEADQAAANIRVVAKVTSRFLREVSDMFGLVPKEVHLIGDGMGAHLMAYVANDFHGTGRITGLDPTRELFELQDRRVRLDPSDAEFVDVIHTNARVFHPFGSRGIAFPAGHVDFYPNGGEEQPGCIPLFHFPKITSLGDLPNLPRLSHDMVDTCSHRRAREYFLEAVRTTGNCIFWGHRVTLPEYFRNIFNRFTEGFFAALTTEVCTDFTCTPMGLETPKYPGRGLYMLTTKRSAPYCIRDPSLSIIKFIDPMKKMLSSFRSKVPLIQPFLPEIDNEGPVP